jgi:hypothetical protein
MEVSLIGKWLDLLKGIAPAITRTAFLFNPDTAPYYKTFLSSFESSAHPEVMEITAAPVPTSGELEATIASLARLPGGSLIVGADASNIVRREAIVRLITQYKLPTISVYRQFAEEGALMSYGPDSEEIFRQSASYIDRILKGEAPASLPAQAPNQVRVRHQSQDCQIARPQRARKPARTVRPCDRMSAVSNSKSGDAREKRQSRVSRALPAPGTQTSTAPPSTTITWPVL